MASALAEGDGLRIEIRDDALPEGRVAVWGRAYLAAHIRTCRTRPHPDRDPQLRSIYRQPGSGPRWRPMSISAFPGTDSLSIAG
jgi:hypothetical protein